MRHSCKTKYIIVCVHNRDNRDYVRSEVWFRLVAYLANLEPVLCSLYDELELMAESGITPDSIPNAFTPNKSHKELLLDSSLLSVLSTKAKEKSKLYCTKGTSKHDPEVQTHILFIISHFTEQVIFSLVNELMNNLLVNQSYCF
jgi:hypothetical protein